MLLRLPSNMSCHISKAKLTLIIAQSVEMATAQKAEFLSNITWNISQGEKYPKDLCFNVFIVV